MQSNISLLLTSYNSAVYSSIYARDYMVFMANEAMLNDTSPASFIAHSGTQYYNNTATYMHASALANNLTRVDVSDCMSAYATTFQTSHGSVILVTSDTNFTANSYHVNSMETTTGDIGCLPDPYGWICGNMRSS